MIDCYINIKAQNDCYVIKEKELNENGLIKIDKSWHMSFPQIELILFAIISIIHHHFTFIAKCECYKTNRKDGQ